MSCLVRKSKISGKYYLYDRVKQGEIKIGISLDSFEKFIIEGVEQGKIQENNLPHFERFLLNRFIRVGSRPYHASSPPIQVMLARPLLDTSKVPGILKKFGREILIEVKYDGERVLVNFVHSRFIGIKEN